MSQRSHPHHNTTSRIYRNFFISVHAPKRSPLIYDMTDDNRKTTFEYPNVTDIMRNRWKESGRIKSFMMFNDLTDPCAHQLGVVKAPLLLISAAELPISSYVLAVIRGDHWKRWSYVQMEEDMRSGWWQSWRASCFLLQIRSEIHSENWYRTSKCCETIYQNLTYWHMCTIADTPFLNFCTLALSYAPTTITFPLCILLFYYCTKLCCIYSLPFSHTNVLIYNGI